MEILGDGNALCIVWLRRNMVKGSVDSIACWGDLTAMECLHLMKYITREEKKMMPYIHINQVAIWNHKTITN